MTQGLRPADALKKHWSAHAPAWALPYVRLSRLDRPVGWQLLYMPCLMGLAVARIGEGFQPSDAVLALLMFIGAVAMRGAGCTYNDIVDRQIDAEVERTRGRPLPAGHVSVRLAWIWLFAQCGVGLLVLLALPRPAQLIALGSIPLVAAYPFMKRITWWPQAWLGLCFSWGALVAGAAARGEISVSIMLLFAGCVAWVIAYDTIYALQDMEDDALVGVRSTARRFGGLWRRWTTGFYIIAIALWGFAASFAQAGWLTAVALLGIGAACISLLLNRIQPAAPETALEAFKANVWIGLGVAAAFALEPASTMLASAP